MQNGIDLFKRNKDIQWQSFSCWAIYVGFIQSCKDRDSPGIKKKYKWRLAQMHFL